MTRPLTIMLSAGEPSGDALGAGLMIELRKMRPQVRIIGVGGPAMQAAGLVSFFGIGDLAVMGIREVVPKLRLLLRRLKQVVAFARSLAGLLASAVTMPAAFSGLSRA